MFCCHLCSHKLNETEFYLGFLYLAKISISQYLILIQIFKTQMKNNRLHLYIIENILECVYVFLECNLNTLGPFICA
jgi:hypothetical protein